MELANVLIDLSKNGPFVETKVINCIASILGELQKQNPGLDWSDNTYRELYLMAQTFARQLEDTIASESATDDSSIFGTAVNYNYFQQQRQF